MAVQDIYGLIVRSLGLAPILWGLFYVVTLVLHLAGLSAHPERALQPIAGAAVCYVLLGFLIIVSAKPITRLVYGRDS
jgi:hypothetical protein